MLRYFPLYVLRFTFHVSRSNRLSRLTISTIFTVLVMSASAAIITVDDDGPADFQSIQAAIDAASEGDVIQVAEGVYQEAVTLKNGITIQGAKTGETRIEFGDAFFVVLMEGIQSGGIFDCTIVHIGQDLGGPGSSIGLIGGTPVVSNNVVTGTQTGIFASGGEPTISNNLIMNNGISGIVIYGGGAANIINNTIVTSQFDGIQTQGGFAGNVTNNIIAYNGRGGIVFVEAELMPLLEYNDLWQNTQVEYYQIEKGSTDISVDPLFMDAESGDYRLAPNSPLRGAGKDGLNMGRIFHISGIASVVVEGSPANAGDGITVLMVGETGGTAHFSIEGIVEGVPMDEIAPNTYRGEYLAQWGDVVEAASVFVTLIPKEGDALTDSSQTATLLARRIQSVSVTGSPALPGDVIAVALMGQPESEVTFSIEGIVADVPMPEVSPGNYVGEYEVKVGDIARNTPVIVRFTSRDGIQLSDDTYLVTVLSDAITVDDDGPADFASIQAAIDAADDGDTVLVAAGTYLEHVEVSKNIHLLGAGRDVTRIEFAGENPTVLVTDVTEASIQGFTLAYNGPEIDDDFRCALWVRASTMVVSANRMTGTGFGIRCTNDSRVEIAGNLIDGNRRSGMVLRESSAQISSNIIQDSGENGILTTDGARITQLRDNQILGNGGTIEDGIAMTATMVETIENNTFKGNGRGGIIAFHGTHITLIRSNQILANERLGIGLVGATIETIENNTIKDNSIEGIVTFAGSQITLIQNNQILANGNDGMQFQGTTVETIQNNTIQNNKRYGIFPLSGSQVTRIQGNQIVANASIGISMSTSAVETIQSNLIKDNESSGISAWGGDNRITWLQDNQITANGDRGIYLERVMVETLQNNVIKDNGSSGIQTWEGSQIAQMQGNEIVANKRGIELGGAPTVGIIQSNTIKDNVEDGIIAFEGGQVTQVQENEITGNGTNGIGLVGTTVETIQNNLIKDSEVGVHTWGGQITQFQKNEITANEAGVQLQDATTIETLWGNLIRDNGIGFYIMEGSQITQFQANQIIANGGYGVSLLTATIEALLNNTIVGNGRDGIITSGLAHVNASNNIIVENGWGGVSFVADPSGTLSPNLAYNDIWNNGKGNYGSGIRPGVTDIHVDPLFVDPDNRDYHVQATSPLIGAGENGVDIGAIPAVIRQMEILGSPARAGETITFRIVAEPNASSSFGIEGVISHIPMQEVEQLDPQAGMPAARYQGEYTVSANDRGIDVPLVLRVETESGYIQIDASQTVTLSGGIQAVEVAGSPAKAGDEIEVTLTADAGGSAEFSIARIAEAIPMMETADGTYQSRYPVKHGDNADDALLTVVWTDKDGRTSLDRSQTVRIDTITVRSAGSPARAGDVLTITAAGKSGNNLTFQIEGLVDAQETPMTEIPGRPGIYTGEYLVKAGDNVENGMVIVIVKMASGDSFENSTATVTIDTIPPDISGPRVRRDETDVVAVQNGETFEIAVTSEPGAFVTVDVSALDTTQSLLALSEVESGRYSRKVTVSLKSEALNGTKTLPIFAIDAAGNRAEVGALNLTPLQVELSNPVELPAPPEEPAAFIRIHPDVLPADGTSTALVTASFANGSITSLSEISLKVTVGHLSDLQLVEQNYLTATYTSGLLVGEATLTLTVLESGDSMSASFILRPPDYGRAGRISWDYLPRYTKIFQPIRISGKLIPQVSGEVVLLTIASPDALANEITELRTDSSGRFEHLLVPDKEGIWSLEVNWPGDGLYQVAQTEPRQVTVVASIPPSPLTESGWSRLTTADRLTSNQVTSLAQDKEGRIWIGTDQGISVFDGQISQTFTTADGLLGNRITAVETRHAVSLRDAQVWIGSALDETSSAGALSHSGLTMYDGLRFHQFTEGETSLSYVLALYEDSRGNLWIGGDGLTFYDGTNFQPIPLPLDVETRHAVSLPEAGREHVVSAFAEDMRGRIWVGTDTGLFLYQPDVGALNLTPLHFTKEGDRLPSDHIQALLMDSQGVLWIGTFPELDTSTGEPIGGGLARYDGRGFEIFDVENSELPSNSVTSLMEDSEGQILIGMLNGGVVRFGEWKPLSTELANRSVNSLLQDSQGQLWVGTDIGLRRLDRQTFNSWEIAQGRGTFFQDREGIIWAGSETGLVRFDGLTWEPVLEFWNVPIHSIAESVTGDELRVTGEEPVTRHPSPVTYLWVGNENGLAIFDGVTWTHLTGANELALGVVTALLPDAQGGMFLGTRAGSLMLFDGENWRDLTPSLTEGELTFELKAITDLVMDSSEILWIGTEEGLFLYDGTQIQRAADLEGRLSGLLAISDLAVDPEGNLWVATYRGLFRFDGAAWRIYTVQNSEIASDYVTSLAIDGLGRIWIGTDSGISRFDGLAFSHLSPEEAWATFTSQNSNLVDDDIRGLFTPVLTGGGDGQIWISTPTAVIRFAPNLRPPETKITRAPRSTVGTDSPFFQYTGSDIESKKEELVYSYKVDSGDWSVYSKSTFVTLPSQSNGVHTFSVRAMDKDGNVDPTPAQRSFRIDITPPIVTIIQPAARQVIGGQFEIQGYAVDDTDFESYVLAAEDEAGQEIFKYESQEPVENDILSVWDTTGVPDGIYTILLTSTDKIDGPDDEAHTSQTSVSVVADNTLPIVNIVSPTNNQALSGIISIRGQASDDNMESYELMWTQSTQIGGNTVWQPIVSEKVRTPDVTMEQTWDSSAVYGLTTVRLLARDRAGNANTSDVTIQLGNLGAKPTARISSPVADAVVAGVNKIIGTADDPALVSYTVDLGAGEQPTDWTEIAKQVTAVTEDTLAVWDTTALPDGKYTLRLTAIDNNEYVSAITLPVIVDNTQPVATILPPADLGRWIAAGNVDIRGTAADTNLDSYIVEYGEGLNPTEWTSIGGTSDEQIADGTLRRWFTAGLDGEYTLRLTVTDKAGLSSVSTQPLTLDNQQSGARILYPEENQFVTGRVGITGTANDANFRRYQISIGQGEEPTRWETLMEGRVPRQADLLFNWNAAGLEGRYAIKLIVEDFTTAPAEEIRRVTVDNTLPQADITSPEDGQIVSGSLEIVGTAQDNHFLNYLVERAPGANPADDAWEEIEGLAAEPITDGVLRRWNTATADDGLYSLRLTVTDDAGHTGTAQRVITVDNQAPEARLNVPTVKGIVTGTVEIMGTASDLNLKEYQVFVAPGEQPGANDWQLIASGIESKTDSVLAEWDTTGLEGSYSIKLSVADLSGQDPVEDTQIVIADNTDPTALITSPRQGDQVGAIIPLMGTAMDANFREYVVEFGEGPSPQIWTRATAIEYRAPVEAGELMQWLPGDRTGTFTLRLTVIDQVDHTSFATVTVDVLSVMAKDEGGERISPDGRAALYLAPRALPGDTVITINSIPEAEIQAAPSAPNTIISGRAYEVGPKDVKISRGKPATLSISYDGLDVALSPDKSLAIARFNGSAWIPIGGSVNEEDRTVMTAITELGRYGLMEIDAAPPEDTAPITNLTCQPRVFSPNGGGFDTHTAISFRLGNSTRVTMKIYSRAGKLKRLLKENEEMQAGVNTVLWDGRDDDNDIVKTDLYIVTVTAGDTREMKTVAVSNR